MSNQIVVPIDEPAFPEDDPMMRDLPDRINPATLPEAPFSVNWRMYRGGEGFQFTVRSFDALTLLDNMEQLITMAEARLWALPSAQMANNMMPAPAAQPVPSVGQQPVPNRATATPQAQNIPGQQVCMMENFEGYVIGSSFSKQTNKQEPCVHLYIAPLEFRLFTIYPERKDILAYLPMGIPTAFEMPSAPPKAQAKAQGFYHATPFSLKVYAEVDENGVQQMRTTKEGKQYPIWRLPTKEEFARDMGNNMPAPAPEVDFSRPAAPAAPPLPTRQIQPAKNIMPALDPSKEPLTAQSLRWTMAGDAETVSDFAIPSPLDGWLIEQREKIAHVIDDPNTDRATQKQWDLLGDWMYDNVTQSVLGTDARAMQVEGIGSVPLAGLLTGVFIDRFALEPSEIPAAAAVYFLQRLKEERQPGVPNPMYDSNFAENTVEVLRQAITTLSADGGW